MVTIIALWLPIVLSAVFVFIASSIIHMFLKYHQSDFSQLPREDEIMDKLREYDIPPGDYYFPYAGSAEVMRSEAYLEKRKRGPVAFINFMKPGPPAMTKEFVLWFIYCLVVSVFAAYIAGRAVPAGGDYLEVFRFAGCTAFAGYALGLAQNSIWYNRSWSATFKSMFDGLIYALLTAGTFGWLWPE